MLLALLSADFQTLKSVELLRLDLENFGWKPGVIQKLPICKDQSYWQSFLSC